MHLAIGIAALAVAFAFLGVEASVVGLVLCLPAILAPEGVERIVALHWVAACYPLIILCSLYLTWFVAWVALGHPPRSSLDDPKHIGPIAIPYTVTAILMGGVAITFVAGIGLTGVRLALGLTPRPGSSHLVVVLGIVPMSWAVGCSLCIWDPLYVMDWYFD